MKALFVGKLPSICLFLAMFLAISGCSNKEPSTPSDSMVQFVEAMHEGNEPKLFAALEASEAQKEFMRATMSFLVAINDFRDAF